LQNKFVLPEVSTAINYARRKIAMARKSSTTTTTTTTKKKNSDSLSKVEVRELVFEVINFACDKTQTSISSLINSESEEVRLTREQALYLCRMTEQTIKDAVFAILASKRL
jgi:hypothetical protein